MSLVSVTASAGRDKNFIHYNLPAKNMTKPQELFIKFLSFINHMYLIINPQLKTLKAC